MFNFFWQKIQNWLKSLWEKINYPLFLFTAIILLIILVVEIFLGICVLEDKKVNEVCSKIEVDEVCSKTILRLSYTIVKYTSQSTIILMVMTFIYLLLNWIGFLRKTKNQENLPKALIEVLIGSLSASAIPTGLSLIVCAFYDIDLIQYMSGVEIYIAFAGISIISIAFLSTLRQQVEIKEMYSISTPEDLQKIVE